MACGGCAAKSGVEWVVTFADGRKQAYATSGEARQAANNANPKGTFKAQSKKK